jgi:hypothetical protein
MRLLKWEPSDQQDVVVFFLEMRVGKNSSSGITLSVDYDGTLGTIQDEVLYAGDDDFEEGEGLVDYKEYNDGDERTLFSIIFNPPTWNL